jgi:acyl carrier protein
LHELTEGLDLAEFVLFSSAAGLFGGAGQGNYAAANAFLDALAQVREARGLVGQSLAWGWWEQPSGMTGGLGEAGLARLARLGLAALSSGEGLGLLDRARDAGGAFWVTARLDEGSLRAQSRAGVLPALLSGLVRTPARRRREEDGSLARRLAGVPEGEWEPVVLEIVREQAATVLGRDSATGVDPQRALKEQGIDSLGAVELRNRLSQATGLRLPATLIFDHPTPAALAGYLIGKLVPDGGGGADAEELRIRRVLAAIPIVRLREAGLYERLVSLASAEEGSPARVRSPTAEPAPAEEDQAAIDEMDAETLVRMTFEAGRAAAGTGGRA